MSYLLGIDLGSSSVKVALVDADSGLCIASASYPDTEAPIKALQPGWAEQRPDDWWEYFKNAFAKCMRHVETFTETSLQRHDIVAIGISYQMHGLVCLDKDMRPLCDAIIWCDSRGVPYGQQAFDTLGHDYCLSHLLNSPGNFTASKLAWVKANEPELFDKIRYIMLPGDYLALRLTGIPATTACGLSEMMLYDYRCRDAKCCVSDDVMNYYGFSKDIIPPSVPTFGIQGVISTEAAKELGLPAGIPVAYRAGDQPNNALSLNVLHPGEIAATAGTSGVVYGVSDKVSYDPKSRVNTFLHVNHTLEHPRLGILHCVNGCGILNAWMHRNVANGMSYDEMNSLAASVPVGSDGVSIIPFGNGAERVLENRNPGCSIHGIDFNIHSLAHLLRATQEGIAFALMYGMELMGSVATIRAGKANMFLSPLFRETLASVSGATIELYDTDGAVGAARGAGLGCGLYASSKEAFASLHRLGVTNPSSHSSYREAYERWKDILLKQ